MCVLTSLHPFLRRISNKVNSLVIAESYINAFGFDDSFDNSDWQRSLRMLPCPSQSRNDLWWAMSSWWTDFVEPSAFIHR